MGVLYGTTYFAGDKYDAGTVFGMSTAGVEKMLYRFTGGSDGANPAAGLINVNTTLYGTTSGNCIYPDAGTVFKISTTGKERVLHSFGGVGDGGCPAAGLTNVNGTLYGTTLYGTTLYGGSPYPNYGTVYKISTTGKEKVVYSFLGGSDGAYPAAGLVNVMARCTAQPRTADSPVTGLFLA